MSKKRLLTVVASSLLAGALWQAPASAEEKPKDAPKTEETKKEDKAAPKTAKKEAKKATPTEQAPKEQK